MKINKLKFWSIKYKFPRGTTKQLMCHQFLALFRQDLLVAGLNFIGFIVKKLSFEYFLAVLLSFR
jgi:hypothetical protein